MVRRLRAAAILTNLRTTPSMSHDTDWLAPYSHESFSQFSASSPLVACGWTTLDMYAEIQYEMGCHICPIHDNLSWNQIVVMFR